MRLYFLRHAEAGEATEDAVRELTSRGRRDARRLGRYLDRIGVELDRAYASPLVRARQTLELVLAGCPLRRRRRPEVAEALTNDVTEAGFRRWLEGLPSAGAVLLVGHEPSLSARVRVLLGLTRAEALPLSKSTVVRVDTEDRRFGVLKLLVNAKQIP